MAVLIGHSSKDENGTYTGGLAGDQTGVEVCTRNWYSGSWGFMAVHPDATVREAIAKAVEQACANDKIGYCQNTRNTLHTQAKANSYDLSKITTACNCDCSSLINTAVVAAGKGSYGTNGWTTSTMQSQLSALGFKILTSNLTTEAYAVRGAIYCKAGSHVVCSLENGSNASTTLTNAGATTSTSTSTSSSSGDISVDGYWGAKTTTKAQSTFGTKQDGIVSNQSTASKKYHTNCQTSSWEYGTGGSNLIEAIQGRVGVEQDRKCGPLTIKGIQGLVGVTKTGYLDSDTVKAFQTWLNEQ